MVLSDLGGRRRPGGPARCPADRPRGARGHRPRAPLRGRRPPVTRGDRGRARARGSRGHVRRRAAPRGDRAPGARARCLPRAQPAARLRPHDRLGPGRPLRPAGRARHRLHGAVRHARTRSAAPVGRPPSRSTTWATTAGARCCLVVGLLAALLEAKDSDRGQVIDAAMVDGAALLTSVMYWAAGRGRWNRAARDQPHRHGSPFYDVYETADGRYVSVERDDHALLTALLRASGSTRRWRRRRGMPRAGVR